MGSIPSWGRHFLCRVVMFLPCLCGFIQVIPFLPIKHVYWVYSPVSTLDQRNWLDFNPWALCCLLLLRKWLPCNLRRYFENHFKNRFVAIWNDKTNTEVPRDCHIPHLSQTYFPFVSLSLVSLKIKLPSYLYFSYFFAFSCCYIFYHIPALAVAHSSQVTV